MHRVLFVCLGNICRSPLAEGILRRQAKAAGLEIEIDSAGIGNWHVGQLPDPRAISVGQSRGCDMSMRARHVCSEDFENFDLLLAMDQTNVQDLKRWPRNRPDKVRLTRSFDPSGTGLEVPDPYYGSIEDFEEVADMLERACQGILTELSRAQPK